MQDIDAIMALEGDEDMDELEAAKAMQKLINSGTVWKLQGSYGRSAMDALEAGLVMLGTESHRDYYGNFVPARTMVEEGTKGSRGLVVQTHGEDWAKALEAV